MRSVESWAEEFRAVAACNSLSFPLECLIRDIQRDAQPPVDTQLDRMKASRANWFTFYLLILKCTLDEQSKQREISYAAELAEAALEEFEKRWPKPEGA